MNEQPVERASFRVFLKVIEIHQSKYQQKISLLGEKLTSFTSGAMRSCRKPYTLIMSLIRVRRQLPLIKRCTNHIGPLAPQTLIHIFQSCFPLNQAARFLLSGWLSLHRDQAVQPYYHRTRVLTKWTACSAVALLGPPFWPHWKEKENRFIFFCFVFDFCVNHGKL